VVLNLARSFRVTCAPKIPPDLCRVRPTKGRTNEGTIYGRTDYSLPDSTCFACVRGTIIKEQESGEKTADVCRRHGISSATFYKYKSKYGGMEPSDAKRLRVLEDENGKLKKLLAEQMLDNAMLRDINSKKW
jgi:putative transposase